MDLIDEDASWEQSLPDGFKRIGDEDSPFLLRGGEKSRKQARQIHTNRDPDDQQRDEQSNEPITRELATWETKVWELDFPFVDTIPRDEIRRRAEKAADVGVKLRFIRSINRNATIQDDGVIGRYRGGSRTILIDAIKTGYLKHEVGRILAHEVGHAFHAGVRALNEKPGYENDFEVVFETEAQRSEAISVSERMRGPIPDAISGFRSYRLQETELFADVFSSLVIEPEAARRTGPEAVMRVEEVLGDILPQTV